MRRHWLTRTIVTAVKLAVFTVGFWLIESLLNWPPRIHTALNAPIQHWYSFVLAALAAMLAAMAGFAMIFSLWRALFPNKGRRLYKAAWRGDEDCVTRLLARRADVNSLEEDVGQTALHVAAMKGHCSVAKLLLSSGAALDLRDKEGWTPLQYAVKSGHREVVELLRGRAKAGYEEAMALASESAKSA
jgi:hypothetical protein